MLFSLLLLAVAVVVGIPALTGKGRLMNTENIKKDKIKTYTKWVRIIYGLLAIVVLVMAFFNFVEKVAYTQTHYFELTQDYQGADGVAHAAGEKHSVDEMLEILKDEDKQSSGSLCAPADTESLPYKYVDTTYSLPSRYAFLGFLSYKAARTLNYVTLGISMVLIFALFLVINMMTDKAAQKKAREAANSPVRPSMPKGAFDFSDYEDEVEVKDDMFDGVKQEIPSKKK